MSRKRDEIEEEEDDYDSISQIKKDLLRDMAKCPKTSEEYRILAQRLREITECEKNETETKQTMLQKWSWLIPTLVQATSNAACTFMSYNMNRKTVRDVLKYEDDGNIVTTKSTGFIKKPRE